MSGGIQIKHVSRQSTRLFDCLYNKIVTYDESKRQINLRKHGIDLAFVESIFDYPMLTRTDTRVDYGEERLVSLGLLHSEVVVLVWTERVAGAHFISCRKAEKHERETYKRNYQ